MSLIPRNSLFDLDRAFDRFFETSPMRAATNSIATPLVDIEEKEDFYEITAEMPGVKRDDIHVHVENGVLSIEACTNEEELEEKEGKIIRKERYSGKMMRSFTLGGNISESDISASFENGILALRIPKQSPEKPTARRIEIS